MSWEQGFFSLCVDVGLTFLHPSIWVFVEVLENVEDMGKTLVCHPFLQGVDILFTNIKYLDEVFKKTWDLISSS